MDKENVTFDRSKSFVTIHAVFHRASIYGQLNCRRLLFLVTVFSLRSFFSVPCVSAQIDISEPPSHSYTRLLDNLNQVRDSLDNWSPIELKALSDAMSDAHSICILTKVVPPNEEALSLAKLCAFGQDWTQTITAAQSYLSSDQPKHVTDGYYYLLEGLANIGNYERLESSLRAFVDMTPRTLQAAEVFRVLLNTLRYKDMRESARIGSIVANAEIGVLTTLPKGSADWNQIYLDCIDYAVLEKLTGNTQDVERMLRDLDAATCGSPTCEISSIPIGIQKARARFDLIGSNVTNISSTFGRLGRRGTSALILGDVSRRDYAKVYATLSAFKMRFSKHFTTFLIRACSNTPSGCDPVPIEQRYVDSGAILLVVVREGIIIDVIQGTWPSFAPRHSMDKAMIALLQ